MKRSIFFISMSHPMFGLGGAEIQTYYYAKAFLKKGWDVYFVSSKSKIVDPNFNNDGIKLFLYDKTNDPLLETLQVIRFVLKYRPQFIFYRYIRYQYGFIVFFCKLFVGTQFIWSTMSDRLCGKTCATTTRRETLHNLYYFKQLVLRLKFYLQDSIFFFGIKNSKYIMVQNRIQENIVYKEFKRNSFIIKNNTYLPKFHSHKEKKILFIATFKSMKQPELFCKLSNYNIKGAQFFIIGQNYSNKGDKNRFNKILLNSNVQYLGHLSLAKTQQLINKSKLLVNTSTFEGFPNTFVQAWARGVPVISLNVDPDNIIQKNKLGYFCAGDFGLMVKYTKKLMQDEELWEETSMNCYKYAIQHLNTDIVVDKIINKIAKS